MVWCYISLAIVQHTRTKPWKKKTLTKNYSSLWTPACHGINMCTTYKFNRLDHATIIRFATVNCFQGAVQHGGHSVKVAYKMQPTFKKGVNNVVSAIQWLIVTSTFICKWNRDTFTKLNLRGQKSANAQHLKHSLYAGTCDTIFFFYLWYLTGPEEHGWEGHININTVQK